VLLMAPVGTPAAVVQRISAEVAKALADPQVRQQLDAQGVTPVSHSDSVQDFIRKGRALEQTVLSRAVWLHLNRRTLVHANRTIVFG
jgi:tripartite-type tricarboxylate transporter receptor subunit TctC